MVTLEEEHGDKILEMLLDSEFKTLSMLLMELGLREITKLEQLTLLLIERLELPGLLELEHGRPK